MSFTRLKIGLMMALTLGTLTAGIGWTAHQALREKPLPATSQREEPKEERAKPGHTDYYGDPLPPGGAGPPGLDPAAVQERSFFPGFFRRWKDLNCGGERRLQSLLLGCGHGSTERGREVPYLGKGPDAGRPARADWQTTTGTVCLFETATGKEIAHFSLGPGINHSSCAFGANGKVLATETMARDSGEFVLRLWDLPTGQAAPLLLIRRPPVALLSRRTAGSWP